MKKSVIIIAFVFILVLIGSIYAEVSSEDILSLIKQNSKGISFSNGDFGGLKATVNSAENTLVYRDSQGKQYTLTGLLKDGQIELDSKGNIIRANFVPSKPIDVVLGGNLKTNLPANSRLTGIDANGKNFDITLSPGSSVSTVPSKVSTSANSDIIINYKVSQKTNIKFPDFTLQQGTISHNGQNYIMRGGNSAVLNGISFYSLGKDGDNPLFFNGQQAPSDLKTGYTTVDFKKGVLKNVGGDGKTQTINFKSGNTIAPIKDNNRLGGRALQNGQMSYQNNGKLIYSYTQGKFVNYNGQLYLEYQGKGLVGFFQKLFGAYSVTPVFSSYTDANGNSLLVDKFGNRLGLLVNQGQNQFPQIQTTPANNFVDSQQNPIQNNNPSREIPNWQNNPDPQNVPVDPPITPGSTPVQSTPPSSQYPFTKEEFLRDIYAAKTSFLVSMATGSGNLGELLKSSYPDLYQKHFTPGSTTTIDQAIADYKVLIDSESKRYGTNPASLANMMKKNQPQLYIKYGKYFGF